MSRLGRSILGVAMLAAALGSVRLGIWQLHRLRDRRANNAVLLAAQRLPPLDLSLRQVADSVLVGRRLLATGHFLGGGTVMLRNRVYRDAPGVYLLTPFRVKDTELTVWVLRGFVNAANGVTPRRPLPPFTPGQVTITGVATAMLNTGLGAERLAITADTTWQRPDSAMLVSRVTGSLPIILHLDGPASGPGGLPTIPMPALSDGPHLSYAIQWFGIAFAILAFGLIAFRKSSGHERAPPL